jgi:predicted DNA-binding transcriptional regulator AlpA
MEKHKFFDETSKKDAMLSSSSTRYMSLRTLSDYSGIPISSLRHYMKHQDMPAFKISGRVYIKQSEFDDWVELRRLNSAINLKSLVNETLKALN